jgi:putative ABC transport system ATP-binding protein
MNDVITPMRCAVQVRTAPGQPSSGAVLELSDVHKTYRLGQHVVPALRGVDLRVLPGEMLALTGPSGSGKSTLLNLAGLIDRPDQGEIRFRGQRVSGIGESEATLLRRDAIGFVFQGFNLVPVMTVADNVDYPLFLAGVPAVERRERVALVLRAVGLDEHAAHRPDALSGGQRQRVAIARALVKRPALVIADEPTASLDSHTADQVLDLMRERGHAQGAAFLIATHDARLLRRCDRVIDLRDGRIVAAASPQEVLS